MPSPFGKDSELCETLRLIAPQFEHRLFLSATPHNGHTRSFTGLLEMLDPGAFHAHKRDGGRHAQASAGRRGSQTQARNQQCGSWHAAILRPPSAARPSTLGRPTRGKSVWRMRSTPFAKRSAVLSLRGPTRTAALVPLPSKFWVSGCFRVRLLLRSPGAARARGFSADPASEADLRAAQRVLRQETGDDREIQQREATAATVVGAWLRNFADDVEEEIKRIESAVEALGFDLNGPPGNRADTVFGYTL